MEKELICIQCPNGCKLTANYDENMNLIIGGNQCPLGEKYGRKELIDPTRTLTTTIQVLHGKIPRVSCRTQTEIPKDKIFDCMQILRNIVVEAPIQIGEVIYADILGTGVDVIATKSVEKI